MLPKIDPRSIPNLTLWLDASDSGTLFDATTGGSLPANNGGVARWMDKGPSAFAFTQSISNNRPFRVTGDKNGLDGVKFDGSNDSLYANSNVFDTGVALLCVFKLASLTNRAPIFDIANVGRDNNRAFTIEANTFLTSGSKFGFYKDTPYDSDLATSTSPVVATITANATNGNAVLDNTTYRINGVTRTLTRVGGSLTNYNDYSIANSVGTALGAFNNNGAGGVLFGGCTIYEFIVWNRNISTQELRRMEQYAAAKWGIGI